MPDMAPAHDALIEAGRTIAAREDSDAAYDAAKTLIERHIADPLARFNLKRAVIEYGKASAIKAAESMSRRLLREGGER